MSAAAHWYTTSLVSELTIRLMWSNWLGNAPSHFHPIWTRGLQSQALTLEALNSTPTALELRLQLAIKQVSELL